MGKLNEKLLFRRKQHLENLLHDIEKDIKEANRLKDKYKKSLDLVQLEIKSLTNEN